MKRLHVTGCPRSGTTLMMEVVSTCFEGSKAPAAEVDIFAPVPGNPEVYFSKQPSDIRRIQPLLNADPNLFCIGMLRDPRSVVTSINHGLPGKYFCNFRVWNNCYAAAKRLESHPQYITVLYEEMATRPDKVQEEIEARFPWLVKKCGFSAYQDIAKSSETSQSALGTVREVSSDRVRSWEKHLPRLKYECNAHPEMADVLVELGYEPDKQWLEALNDVQPDKGGCRYRDKENPFKFFEYRVRTHMKTKRYIRNLP